MKISRNWLGTFFDRSLPEAPALADALTFHAFEIESIENVRLTKSNIEDQILDVKVTPNRGHDCLSHRGIAKELAAILDLRMKPDALREATSLDHATDAVSVSIQRSDLCNRYIAGYMQGVKVGPSPDWLKSTLESIGQRPINNVVDATNFIMFNLGQPLHAFDASKLKIENGKLNIVVRNAKEKEKMVGLDDNEYILAKSMLIIADGNADAAIGIAGVKGGKPAGVSEATKDIIIESANFDGASVRKAAQALKLRTDASFRFEQGLSPELAAYGMHAVAVLIQMLAGGEIVGFADEYPFRTRRVLNPISLTLAKINAVLGTSLKDSDIADAFTRLDLPFKQNGDSFTVTPPFERLALTIPEDIIEEVARIVGYDKIPTTPLSSLDSARGKPHVNPNFAAAERVREEMMGKGYSEVFTSVFAEKGERVVANKADGTRPYLRSTLVPHLKDAYEKNKHNKDLLGLMDVRIFEIGTVWKGRTEIMMLGTADKSGVKEIPLKPVEADSYEDHPLSTTERYQPISKNPITVREIPYWSPQGTEPVEVLDAIRREAGTLD